MPAERLEAALQAREAARIAVGVATAARNAADAAYFAALKAESDAVDELLAACSAMQESEIKT